METFVIPFQKPDKQSKQKPRSLKYLQDLLILNKKSKPCVRALKTDFTKKIYDEGHMDMSSMMGIKNLYFNGDMNAAPALAGQSIGLIDEIKSVDKIINGTIIQFNEIGKNMGNHNFTI